jgi:deazaflavin-dependent oxidoreductase (nitroreductase family)
MPSTLGRFTQWASQVGNRRGLYLGRRSTRVHVALYRRSGGRIGGHLPGWPGARIVLVDHVGAKTGRRRTSPVMYKELGDAIVIAGSKGGQPTHPAWYHNLLANPETTVQLGSEVRPVRARVAAGEERARLWGQLVDFFPGYDFYRSLAGDREIPVIVLEPREPPPAAA